jgi:ABC-type multidrug transport system ATPase subunit
MQDVGNSEILPSSVTLSWHSVQVRTPITLKQAFTWSKSEPEYHTILYNINGLVEPGQLLALLGPSGSGKTSLLNVLNFRSKNLVVNGEIKINGVDVDATQMAMFSGYVEQEDLFFENLTVREHLEFHALLRMDKSVTKVEKLRRVDQVLKDFNLEKSCNVNIGVVGRVKGISGGEKKRLAFSTEVIQSN